MRVIDTNKSISDLKVVSLGMEELGMVRYDEGAWEIYVMMNEKRLRVNLNNYEVNSLAELVEVEFQFKNGFG